MEQSKLLKVRDFFASPRPPFEAGKYFWWPSGFVRRMACGGNDISGRIGRVMVSGLIFLIFFVHFLSFVCWFISFNYSNADKRMLEKYSEASLACFSCHSFSHCITFSWISFSLVIPFLRALAEKFARRAEVFAFSGFFLR